MSYPNEFDLLIRDVKQEYLQKRRDGESRSEAVRSVMDSYAEEAEDCEENLALHFGLLLALAEHNELYPEFSERARLLLAREEQEQVLQKPARRYVQRCAELVNDPNRYGDEAIIKKRRVYNAGLKIGDTFAHKITCPVSEPPGLKGQFIVLTVAGEYDDISGRPTYLMYGYFAEDLEVLSNPDRRSEMRCVRAMRHDNGWDYFFQVGFTSKKKQQAFELTYVGTFSDLPRPTDHVAEDPRVAMPLYADFEPHFCRLYQSYGTFQAADG